MAHSYEHLVLRILAIIKKVEIFTSGSSLLDSTALALFAKHKEQIVSPTSSSHGLT